MFVAVVGSGYVGLVTGACLADLGHQVVCVDKDAARIAALKMGRTPIYEPDLDAVIARNTKLGRLHFSTSVQEGVENANVVFIAVGTPSREDGQADLNFLHIACGEIANCVRNFTVIVAKSTVPVGTCDEIAANIQKLNSSADVAVVSNPEFLREGAAVSDFFRPDRIVIGYEDERARPVLEALYRPLGNDTPILYTRRRNAELIKYASNAFLAMKVAYINEIANLCEAVGGDVVEVAQGMGLDPRIGKQFLTAGPGFGGSCFPKDTLALSATAQIVGSPLTLVDATIAANDKRKADLSRRVQLALGNNLRGHKVAVLGLAFKAGTDDTRQSPALELVPALVGMGARVSIHDPKVSSSGITSFGGAKACSTVEEAISQAEACVVLTEWQEYRAIDPQKFRDLMKRPLVIDFRNLFDANTFDLNGITLIGVGRPSSYLTKSIEPGGIAAHVGIAS